MRLDKYLTENNYYKSRTRAERAISEGFVMINGNVVVKPSFDVCDNDLVEALPDPIEYVSRGALKLLAAFSYFDIDVNGKDCIDIGASSGGFTEILLRNGAAKVYAVDVGTGQLDPKISGDERVVNLEKTDVRKLGEDFNEKFDVCVCDCSFISLKKILPTAMNLMKRGAFGVFLIKPQFETENNRKLLGKKGVIKDEKQSQLLADGVIQFAKSIGFQIKSVSKSPVRGGDGNIEYLLYIAKS